MDSDTGPTQPRGHVNRINSDCQTPEPRRHELSLTTEQNNRTNRGVLRYLVVQSTGFPGLRTDSSVGRATD